MKRSVIFATAVLLAACGGNKEQGDATAQEQPLMLSEQDVAAARLADIAGGAVLTGSLQPAWIVTISAQVPGTMQRIAVDRGTAVREGQVLGVIQAEGIRGAAEGARAGVAAAQANLAVARQRMESAETLRKAGAMSEIDYKAAAAGYEAARAQLAAARAQAAGAIEQAVSATVRAPMTGVINTRSVDVGENVNPGQELFTLVRSDELELAGQVPLEAAANIRPGQPVVFTIPAYPNREFRGTVARIEPMANPQTRQVGVYVRMKNPGGIVGGQFATGRIVGVNTQESTVIPQSAVRGSGADTHVLVIQNGVVAKRPIQVGAADPASGMIAVTQGLQPGELVITASTVIAEGARVQVGASAPAAAPAPTEGKE
ncbi:MAG TPA: efflux RND transporter periplasmic adaptor subunit [Longimicrobiales bacterium]|nr:efflux RND transporter periplasmic adaptor subunit [Longimicrobiales bacterium]